MKLNERQVNRVGKELAELTGKYNRAIELSQPAEYMKTLIYGFCMALTDCEIDHEINGPSPSRDFYSVIYVQGKMFVPKMDT